MGAGRSSQGLLQSRPYLRRLLHVGREIIRWKELRHNTAQQEGHGSEGYGAATAAMMTVLRIPRLGVLKGLYRLEGKTTLARFEAGDDPAEIDGARLGRMGMPVEAWWGVWQSSPALSKWRCCWIGSTRCSCEQGRCTLAQPNTMARPISTQASPTHGLSLSPAGDALQ